MMNLTSQYALQALIYIAQQPSDELISSARIAEETGVPPKYLSVLLRELVRHRVLESTRGKGGGFKLARPADVIMLETALRPFEPVLAAQRPCPFGNTTCSDENPCSGHDRWKLVRQAYNDLLQSTSIQDVTQRPKRPPQKKGRRATRK